MVVGYAVVLAAATSCQTTPAVPAEPAPYQAPHAPVPPAPEATAPIAIEPSVDPAPIASPAPAPEPSEGPTSCPDGMVLVEGDYCTEVRHTCLVEWYAKQNNKRVCEQFKPESKCVGSKIKKRYCIDKFAWPNVEGERPEVMNQFYQAQVKCAAAGKRMCTESEWTFACEGPEAKPFPYGYTRDPKKCNGDHKWDGPDTKKIARRDARELARLWRGVPSGSQPECVSDFGVHDLPGNNDEVVSGESPKAQFASVNTGGPWYSGVRNQCRPKIYTHDEGFYYYFLGFRCCAAPDGGPNDPRTKRQIAEKWDMNRIERLAGFTVEQMKIALELKKKGECQCQGRMLGDMKLRGPDYICKTMCGTLLGPNAKDGDDTTRMLHESRRKVK
jgi:hypothetical protein